MAGFEISHADAPHTCVVRLHGDVDVSVVPELQAGLKDVISGGCENIVLDLADVTYADSSALGLLVWLDRQMQPCNGRMFLAGANPDVTRILEISGLARVATSITTSEDVGTALGGLELSSKPSDLLWHRQIQVPLDVNRLSMVREEVSDLVEPLGFSEGAIFDIKVALGEALANALRHGKPAEGAASVSLGVDAYSDRLVLQVTDNGFGFDGAASSADDVYAPGGRGVMFMHALMDRVDFSRAEGGGTMVSMVKHRPNDAH